MFFRPASVVLLAASLGLDAATPWAVARNEQFIVYAQRGEGEARAVLGWFAQLHSIVDRHFGVDTTAERPVLVFGFDSLNDYEPYRLRATADAYYVGTDERDYIVMTTSAPQSFGTAAHEYAHLLLHRAGLHLPPWLSEGLADVFSTVRITHDGVRLGGEPFGRLNALRDHDWLPIESLLSLAADSPLRNTRDGSAIFYAQSWALTEMLLLSPEYGPHFRDFFGKVSRNSSRGGAEALESAYGKSPADILQDVKTWVRRRKTKPVGFEAALPSDSPIEFSEASDRSVRLMMAGMLLAAEDLDAADSIYHAASLDAPKDGAVLGGLAAVALAKGKVEESLQLFRQALSYGLADASLCWRYAVLLDRYGGPVEDRRAALEHAIELRPDFDDALYGLALLEKNLGNNESALTHLRAMRHVAPPRAYHYWFAVADALTGLGRNDEAVNAAKTAATFAADGEERLRAADLAHTAETHLAVRFVSDAAGRQKLVTTRVPNGATDWNPFIEPADDIHRIEGKLLDIDCSGNGVRVTVGVGAKRSTLAIPDLSRVQMRNGPGDFVCGVQPQVDVVVEYAAHAADHSEGIVRGMEFR